MTLSAAARAPVTANNGAGEADLYQIARLVYGAADALVTADIWGQHPVMRDSAASYRDEARKALTAALNQLDMA